ncbi:MAG: Trm112 family protein [Gammaproteobacteria bacterium]|nr:Trm112 family protein [Gammaproteobacteria bacterium]
MDKELLDILVCPVTKGPLIYRPASKELWSVDSKLAYAVRDDIPVLIAAEARELTQTELKEIQSA